MAPSFHELPMPTFGGGPAWEEVGGVGEYRIQRNRLTGHHRLLDGSNIRRAWGSLETCEEVLARIISRPDDPTPLPNLVTPTFGGMQFWADEMVRCGWRIQRSVFTGHCRLLDASDCRQAWGSFDQCEMALRRLHDAAGIEPTSERMVVLVHGILGWKNRWSLLADALRKRGFEPVDVNYPSTQGVIEEHVAQLARVVEGLGDCEEISFITHSLGGLIVRRLLAEHDEIRARRVVMMAPPNQGAVTADMVCDLVAYKLVFGPAGAQLVTGVNSHVRNLPPPPCEFGVIAGGRGDGRGFNPLIEGDDDGVVPLEATKLEGMSDFLVLPHLHSAIIRAPAAIEAAVRFVETGRFR
jgi:hypothetical protein